MDTPIGLFSAVVDDDGAVLASGWTPRLKLLLQDVHPKLRPKKPRRVSDLGEVSRAVQRYHNGELDATDTIPVRQAGGRFTEHVWEILRKIPPGEPLSYLEFASLAGSSKAARAVAQACARNSAGMFVPCHRIIRSDGSMGGFRWGVERKSWLLEHEAR